MANDAIANLAKPGEIDEEPFLEERWDRVIAVMTDGVGEKVDRDDTGARPLERRPEIERNEGFILHDED
jgi:hypothetical protein